MNCEDQATSDKCESQLRVQDIVFMSQSSLLPFYSPLLLLIMRLQQLPSISISLLTPIITFHNLIRPTFARCDTQPEINLPKNKKKSSKRNNLS